MFVTGPFYKSLMFWLGLAIIALMIKIGVYHHFENGYLPVFLLIVLGVIEGVLFSSYIWYKHTMDMIEMWEERITILKVELARSDDPQLIRSLENLAQWENGVVPVDQMENCTAIEHRNIK